MQNVFFFGQNGFLGGLFLNVNPTTISTPAAGSNHTINVTSNVSWSVVQPTLGWISITSGGSGTGNGSTVITTSSNNTGSSRSGLINYTGDEGLTASISITQVSLLSFNASPNPLNFLSSGGLENITVTTDALNWSAAIIDGGDWISISSGGSGSGNGTTVVEASSNPITTSRFGTIRYSSSTTNNFDVTVIQDAGSPT